MTRDEWTARICADFGLVLAAMDDEPSMRAAEARRLAESGAVWLLEREPAQAKTLAEALGLAALLLVMVRETCIEDEAKRAATEKAS